MNKEEPAGKATAGAAKEQTQEITKGGMIWVFAFLLLSVLSMTLVIASSIVTLVFYSLPVSLTFLELYTVLFAVLGLTAEFRLIRPVRIVVDFWIRYFYFLTTYAGRGLFYIFLGVITIGGTTLNYVAAATTLFLGVLMFFASLCVDLPVYRDT
uniref:COPI associated protein n=1 Tax=Trypanosoma congolense (strain IL3000) TaxID=1068625 RepID=G0UU38_TRYCI|nr:conserved hypothetical protein [Trypanosoma congolense IL3000]